jgi:CelD/BcsL family acetyltransferase involved in cellulose biosynthesis
MLRLEIIGNVTRWQEIALQWNSLCARAAFVTPFQLPAWQFTWWQHFGSGQLHVFAFWRGETLVGLIPCFLHQWNNRDQLTLIGSGVSDYLEPVAHPDEAVSVVAELAQFLEAHHHWQVCDWQDLNADSPLCQLQSTGEWQVSTQTDTPCAEVSLAGNFEDFWQTRPKDLRRNMRRYTERALALGPITFEVVDRADTDLLDALIALHAVRWQKRGETGMIASNNSAEFLKAVAPELATQGLLRFFVLRFQGKIVAIIWTLFFRQKIFSYLSALDPDYEIYGFGRTLLFEAFRYCYGNQISAWNFMRGDEPYKFSWGATLIPKSRICITR